MHESIVGCLPKRLEAQPEVGGISAEAVAFRF